jgi:hypothetical protein
MHDLTTKAGLAREADIDPRNPVLDALEPVGQIKLRDPHPVKVYDRSQAVKELAKLLAEAQAKYAQD